MPAVLARLLLLLPLDRCVALLSRTASKTHAGDSDHSLANDVTNSYYWPSGRGHVGHYSASLSVAPVDLKTSLAWTWHDPAGRYRNSPVGVNLDDKQNIYMTSLDGIRKFMPDGELIWTYAPVREKGEEMPDTASLYNGAVYCSTTHGRIFAISMETGKELWTTRLQSCDMNNGWVSVYDGVVIAGSDVSDIHRGEHVFKMADQNVTGLDAKDGRVLWQFTPEAPVWNFMGSFVGDGTFIFQDYEGRAYRNRVQDGALVWKSGGHKDTWTDGSALMGPNGVVYTVSTLAMDSKGKDGHGHVSAFRLEDGQLLWETTVPRPPNNMPAIGRLAGRTNLSLVQPIGQQVLQGAPTDVYALDAETGKVQWIFNGPAQKGKLQAGDGNMIAQAQRTLSGIRPITLPNPWSAPSIDARGTVYIGSEEGPIYSLRDVDGSGMVEGPEEVSMYDARSCFSGSSSPAIGDGMMVIGSIDQLYVFKTK